MKRIKIVGISIILAMIIVLILCIAGIYSIFNGSGNPEHIKQGYEGVPFSRANTEQTVENVENFGTHSTDEVFVGLDYIYHDKNLKDLYGSSFEVSDYGGTSDGYLIGLFLISFYKGVGTYYATIDDDVWTIQISKTYFGEWMVDSLTGPEPVK